MLHFRMQLNLHLHRNVVIMIVDKILNLAYISLLYVLLDSLQRKDLFYNYNFYEVVSKSYRCYTKIPEHLQV
jgi:hypothetical protein